MTAGGPPRTPWDEALRWFTRPGEQPLTPTQAPERPPTPTGWEEAMRHFASEGAPPTDAPAPEEQPTGPQESVAGEPAGAPAASVPPPPSPAPRRHGHCQTCDARLEPGQSYCLSCGTATTAAPRLVRSVSAPALIAGAIAVMGVGAAALALAVAAQDDSATTTVGEVPPPITAPTSPPVTGTTGGPLPPDTTATAPAPPPPTGFDTVTSPTGPVPPATDPVPTPTPTPGASDWPAGTTAWTAILSSVRSQPDAEAAKTKLQGQGEEAGVLFSTDHPGMRPGYYVVFSGVFDSRGAAISQADSLGSEFAGAYARQVRS